MNDNSSNKRRRVSADLSAGTDPTAPTMIHLSALPIGVLSHVSSFLAAPSRALFAATLFGNDENNDNRSKIAGNDWDTLDFGDIEAALAAKLSDDHLNAMLRCIDAVRKVKKLRLTNCMTISGAGLEPLRGSDVIERIDLRIYGWEPAISCDFMLPILDLSNTKWTQAASALMTKCMENNVSGEDFAKILIESRRLHRFVNALAINNH